MDTDLFGNPLADPTIPDHGGSLSTAGHVDTPLAVRMRPRTIDEVVGQDHLLGPGSPLRRLAEGRTAMSVFLWGPPGVGKTTIAAVVSASGSRRFVELSAVTAGVKEVRSALAEAKRHLARGVGTVLFVDEVHRFSKAQQDVLLPAVENRLVTLIAATTENPSFSVISPLLSRSLLLTLQPLTDAGVSTLLERALSDDRGLAGAYTLDGEARDALLRFAGGDARRALTYLEEAAAGAAAQGATTIDVEVISAAVDRAAVRYDRGGDQHYDVISAFIKSLRGSDVQAGLHYLARMLEAGEDPRFIARRLIILASEDIGLAAPSVLQTCVAAAQAVAADRHARGADQPRPGGGRLRPRPQVQRRDRGDRRRHRRRQVRPDRHRARPPARRPLPGRIVVGSREGLPVRPRRRARRGRAAVPPRRAGGGRVLPTHRTRQRGCAGRTVAPAGRTAGSWPAAGPGRGRVERMTAAGLTAPGPAPAGRPWPALWALVIGFFMILVDTTIVSVANPRIMQGLGADINAAIWVTSAYLLAFAVPLLVTGRLGDRYGPKRVYLLGLVVFTGASTWCGFAGSIETLIAARGVQGLGAALLTPQTMAVITRTFAPNDRGRAMSLWGATAAVATLVGPVLGGLLVDALGWEWVFFVNLPVGVVGFVLAWRLVPDLETHRHRFDLPGVALWAVGMTCLVFGIQEGQTYRWGTIVGPVSVWGIILTGFFVLAGFVWWQSRGRGEPLLPLRLFRDRNFTLSNVAIGLVGLSVTANALPLVFYYQLVLGFSPTRAALQLVPMAVLTGLLAPVAGRLIDRVQPRILATGGLLLTATSMAWYSVWLVPDESLWWRLLLPSALTGIAGAFTFGPISSAATWNLPAADAGAGSGVYNSVRQIGSVLGSAAIAALIQARLVAEGAGAAAQAGAAGRLPEALRAGFSAAMATSMLLPAAAALLGAVAAACFGLREAHQSWPAPVGAEPTRPGR